MNQGSALHAQMVRMILVLEHETQKKDVTLLYWVYNVNSSAEILNLRPLNPQTLNPTSPYGAQTLCGRSLTAMGGKYGTRSESRLVGPGLGFRLRDLSCIHMMRKQKICSAIA